MLLDLKVVAEGLEFPEGPVAADDGSVLFVQIEGQKLSRLTVDDKVETVADNLGGPNGLAVGPDGAVYVCNNGGIFSFEETGDIIPHQRITIPKPKPEGYKGGSIQRVDLASGKVTDIYTSKDESKLLAPDDICFDENGGFYFTASGYQDQYKGLELQGALYYGTIHGDPLKQVASIPMPNGVRLSPGGKTIYVSDTIFGRLWALDIDGPGKVKPGPLPVMPGRIVQTLPSFSIPQWFHEAFGVPPPPASPRPLQGIQWLDSLAVEANGQVCVGTIFNGGITIFDPDTGATTHETVPDIFTTNLCFGGPDMQDVWITASSTGKIYKARWPRPGLRLAHTLRDSRSGVLV